MQMIFNGLIFCVLQIFFILIYDSVHVCKYVFITFVSSFLLYLKYFVKLCGMIKFLCTKDFWNRYDFVLIIFAAQRNRYISFLGRFAVALSMEVVESIWSNW